MSASNTEVGLMPSCSAFVLPMECGNDETVETLPLENEVASRNSASAFLTAVSLRSAQEPFEHDFASVEACELILEARRAIGSEGIRAYLDYLDEFNERIHD